MQVFYPPPLTTKVMNDIKKYFPNSQLIGLFARLNGYPVLISAEVKNSSWTLNINVNGEATKKNKDSETEVTDPKTIEKLQMLFDGIEAGEMKAQKNIVINRRKHDFYSKGE
jgi:vancomycin resistance protein YoaR